MFSVRVMVRARVTLRVEVMVTDGFRIRGKVMGSHHAHRHTHHSCAATMLATAFHSYSYTSYPCHSHAQHSPSVAILI